MSRPIRFLPLVALLVITCLFLNGDAVTGLKLQPCQRVGQPRGHVEKGGMGQNLTFGQMQERRGFPGVNAKQTIKKRVGHSGFLSVRHGLNLAGKTGTVKPRLPDISNQLWRKCCTCDMRYED